MTVISLSRIIAHWKDKGPNKPLISFEGETVSRAEFDASTNRLARAYETLGVGQDDFVTIALPNGIEFFAACFATWKLGATPQPISAKLPKFERDAIIDIGKPVLVVGAAPGSQGNVTCIDAGYIPDAGLSDDELPEKTAKHFKVMTSGGSTGRPKLIVSELPAVTDTDVARMGFEPEKSAVIPGPLYHNGPFLWAMSGLFVGNHVTVFARFDAENMLRLMDENKANLVYMVPTMMLRIWRLPEEVRLKYDLSTLEVLWHLAAPCPQWLKEEYIAWLGPEVIFELYGGTEGQGTTIIDGNEWLEHRGSVGKPVPGCEMKIVDEDGKTLPAGEIGEVFLLPEGGQGSTYHYIGDKAKDIEGGWESLGDMGYMDADGYLYLADRQTDMILSGAANIYPAEIEGAIEAFPGVRGCAVIGLPDEDMGNLVHAIVDVPDGNVAEDALVAHLNERLVRYKVPRTFEFVSEPVRDDAGKVRRKQLRAQRVGA
jgi:bile acid-coenzyme A ligase